METAGSRPFAVPRPAVLVVEDNDVYRQVVVAALAQYLEDCQLAEADSVASALTHLKANRPSVLVVDMTLPDGTALDLLERARMSDPDVSMVVFSNHAEEDMLPLLDRKGVRCYVEKAAGVKALAVAVRTALQQPAAVT